jgi:hypothetical protein
MAHMLFHLQEAEAGVGSHGRLSPERWAEKRAAATRSFDAWLAEKAEKAAKERRVLESFMVGLGKCRLLCILGGAHSCCSACSTQHDLHMGLICVNLTPLFQENLHACTAISCGCLMLHVLHLHVQKKKAVESHRAVLAAEQHREYMRERERLWPSRIVVPPPTPSFSQLEQGGSLRSGWASPTSAGRVIRRQKQRACTPGCTTA